MIRAHQPGSEPIDIPETIPNSGCGTQANTYSDRTRSQGAGSESGEGSLERRLSRALCVEARKCSQEFWAQLLTGASNGGEYSASLRPGPQSQMARATVTEMLQTELHRGVAVLSRPPSMLSCEAS